MVKTNKMFYLFKKCIQLFPRKIVARLIHFDPQSILFCSRVLRLTYAFDLASTMFKNNYYNNKKTSKTYRFECNLKFSKLNDFIL